MAKSAAPLLLVAGAAFLFMGGKKKKKTPKACPPIVHIVWENLPTETLMVRSDALGREVELKLSKVAYHDALKGNRDIFDISSKALAPFIPAECLTSNSVKVDILAEDGSRLAYKAVEFFFLFSNNLLESLYSAGLFSKDETQYSSNELTKWWVSNMGEAPLPED